MSKSTSLGLKNIFGPFALVVAIILAAPNTRAVVIRHDKTDQDALRLGEEFAAAGRVLPDGSCTLIAPTWVMTAAHVGRSMRAGTKVEFGGKQYTVKRVIVHPDGSGPPGRPPKVDMALVELTRAVEGIKPAKIYREDDELGKTLYIVGYGDYGLAKSKLKHTDGKRRAVTNVVDDAGPRKIFLGFDEPPKGTEFEGVGGPGDSGGPALLKDGDDVYIVGVSSGSMNGKPGQYGVIDVYTRVGSYTDWIDENMKPGAVAGIGIDAGALTKTRRGVRRLQARMLALQSLHLSIINEQLSES